MRLPPPVLPVGEARALSPVPGVQSVATAGVTNWLRAIATVAWLLGPAYGLLRLAALLRGSRPRRLAENAWLRSARALLGLRVEVQGLEHIDPNESYVVAPLHESLADPIVLSALPLRLRYLATDELFEWPWLGNYLRRSNHLRMPIGLGMTWLLAIRTALRSNDSVVIFPQGSVLGIELAFHDGAARIARVSGRPLLPIVISGTHRVWEYPFTPRLRFGQRVTLRVLPPVLPEDAVATFPQLERTMRGLALSSETAAPRRFDPGRDGYWDGYPYRISSDFPDLAARVAARRAARDDESRAGTLRAAAR